MTKDPSHVSQALTEFEQGNDAQKDAAEKRLNAAGEQSPRQEAASKRKAAKEKDAADAGQAKRSAPDGRQATPHSQG